LQWHIGEGIWSCVNPSACLVWQVRDFCNEHLVHQDM
jgi:hypothetical protein